MRYAAVMVATVAIACSCLARAAPPADLLRQLDAAEAKWQQASPAQYQFTFRYSAMFRYTGCASGSFQVRVTHGTPGRLRDCESLKGTFATVPLLFKYIRKELASKPDTIQVSFDPALGYPLSFEVDHSNDISDDHFSFEIRDFEWVK